MDSHEGVNHHHETDLLTANRGNRSLDVGIAAYLHADRLDRQSTGGGLERTEEHTAAAGRRIGIEHDPGTFDPGRNLTTDEGRRASRNARSKINLTRRRTVASWQIIQADCRNHRQAAKR